MAEELMTPCEKCGQLPSWLGGDWPAYALPDADLHVLCDDCAADAGFCISCGGFFGGTEEFFRSGIKGCCVDCKAEIDGEDNDRYDAGADWSEEM